MKPGRLEIRADSTNGNILRDHLYLNNAGSNSHNGDTSIISRNYTSNFVTRFQKDRVFAMGTTSAIVHGTISSLFEIDIVEDEIRMIGKVSGQDVERFNFDLDTGTFVMRSMYIANTPQTVIDFFINVNTTNSGRMQFNGLITQYINHSDIRLKDNITPIKNHFEILDKLNIKLQLYGSYNWPFNIVD